MHTSSRPNKREGSSAASAGASGGSSGAHNFTILLLPPFSAEHVAVAATGRSDERSTSNPILLDRTIRYGVVDVAVFYQSATAIARSNLLGTQDPNETHC